MIHHVLGLARRLGLLLLAATLACSSAGGTTSGGTSAGGSSGAGAGGQTGGTTGGGGRGGSGGADGAGAGGAGASGAGGSGGQLGSCDDLSCPDLGTCTVERVGDGCVRTCAFDEAYSIKSNADVARLAALACTIIDGTVEVVGGEADSLGGLESVGEVTGDLSIDSAKLTDLKGLDALEKVRMLTVEREDIESVVLPALRSVNAFTATGLPHLTTLRLPSLVRADTVVMITACPILPSIELNKLETVGQAINISLNDELMTLNGLPALTSVPDMHVASNPKLPECEVDAIAARFSTHCTCNLNDSQATCN